MHTITQTNEDTARCTTHAHTNTHKFRATIFGHLQILKETGHLGVHERPDVRNRAIDQCPEPVPGTAQNTLAVGRIERGVRAAIVPLAALRRLRLQIRHVALDVALVAGLQTLHVVAIVGVGENRSLARRRADGRVEGSHVERGGARVFGQQIGENETIAAARLIDARQHLLVVPGIVVVVVLVLMTGCGGRLVNLFVDAGEYEIVVSASSAAVVVSSVVVVFVRIIRIFGIGIIAVLIGKVIGVVVVVGVDERGGAFRVCSSLRVRWSIRC